MSGVVDENGQQWERCDVCRRWIRIEDLVYEGPTEAHPHGRDACTTCYEELHPSAHPEPSVIFKVFKPINANDS